MITTPTQVNGLTPEQKRALLKKLLDEKRERSGLFPLSFAQQRLWFIDKLQPGTALYNIPTVLRLAGKVDFEALRKGLEAVVARHEALRTTFVSREDTPFQKINPPAPVEFHFIDLQQMDEETRKESLDKFVTQEIRRPFNLTEDGPVRATLLRTDVEEYILALVIHHIAADEWSMQILFREWASNYSALLKENETAPSLPALEFHYADYAQQQREWIQSENFQKQLDYWRSQLREPLPILQLPTDRPRPSTQTYNGTAVGRVLPKELLHRVSHFAREQQTTMFMLVLAAFKVLLHRYTQQEEIIVGSPIAGRQRIETEPLIGFFVNTLALRSSFAGDPTFKDFLGQVRRTTLGAYENQEVPFDKLVEELHPERSATHAPIVQTLFSLEREQFDESIFPGIKTELLEVDTGTAKFELIVVGKETPQGLKLTAEFNTDIFDRERIKRMLEHFQYLLENAISQPQARVSELSLLSPAERMQLVGSWNNTRTNYPRSECIHQVFEERVARNPDASAVKYGEETLSYRELNARANQLAHRLQKLKLAPGSPVGVFMDRSIEMIVSFAAILKAGGAYLPLDLSYPRERLAFMVDDAKMPIILTQQRHADQLPQNGTTVICLDSEWSSIAEESRQLPPNRATPDSAAYIIYTSGSTGVPKGVVIPHKGVTRLVLITNYVHLTPGDRIAQASNASFDAATFEIWGALLNAALLVGISKEVALSPSDFAETLRREQITTLFVTTALFNQMAREVPGVFGSLDTLLFGGEAVDPKWVRSVLECKPPKRLLHVYGPTENTTFSSWYHVREVDEDATTVPIGKPISNSTLYILDSRRNPVPIGIPGEIYVGGDGLAQCYWNRPELTAEKFVRNPFELYGESCLYKTGDIGRFDANGNVEFIGRADHQVKIRGFRIELGEIEALLAKHPQVSDSVVVVREDIPGDRRLVGYIVAKQNAPSASELKSYLRAQLPDYMVPAAFVFLVAFPMTPNEKIDRKALPAPDQTRPDLNKHFVAPRNSVEKQLAKIWEQTLGVQPVGVADNFFELGGHSLLAVKLFSQIEKQFEKKLPLATLFRAPTIEELAAILQDRNGAAGWSTIVEIQPKGSRPPFFWIHSLGGDGGGGFFYYRKLAELLGPDQPSFGIRSPEEPFSYIEEMANFYVSEIRKFQGEGPYYLGGFCFGGNVAFEMAQQLLREGEEVALLVMLETAPPNVNQKQSWSATAAKYSIENLLENVKDFVNHSPHERIAMLKQKGKRLTQKFKGKIAPPEHEDQSVQLKDVLDLTNYPKDYVKYAQTHWQALTEYQPKSYPGEITLFRAKKQSLSNFNHTLCWDSLVDDRVNVTVIPGTHESMLQEPNVQIIAAKLRALLDNAHAKHNSNRELAVAG